jgi:hypothetical protein
MAGNLVSQILQSIKPEIVSRIASALGIKATDVEAALAGSVPAILAVLVGVVSKPDGVRRLIDAATQLTGTSVLNSLGAGNVNAVADKGSSALSSLVGGSSLDGLTSAIARYSGLDQGKVSTLVGLVAPFIMNGIRQEAGGLDAGKITSLLLSQKDSIAAALPSGLSSSEVLSGMRSAGSAAQQAGRSASAKATSDMNWLMWAIPLILIIGGLWYFLGRERPHPPTTPAAETTTTAPPAATSTADPTAQVTTAIASLKTALEGITDSASAKAAVPKLQEVDGQLTSVNNLVANLSADQKKALAAVVVGSLPAINQLFDKILAIPGVAEITKPVIDGLRAKLDSLSKL